MVMMMTSPKVQLLQDTDKIFEDKLQKRKTGHVIIKIWQTQSTNQNQEFDRLTHAHNEENVTTVRELVAPLRQEDQKQTHRSTSQISKGTNLMQCNIVQIIHCVFVWNVFRLPTRMLPNIAGFPYIYISQGSVATQLRCGGIFNNHLWAVKEFWESINIWRRYGQ